MLILLPPMLHHNPSSLRGTSVCTKCFAHFDVALYCLSGIFLFLPILFLPLLFLLLLFLPLLFLQAIYVLSS